MMLRKSKLEYLMKEIPLKPKFTTPILYSSENGMYLLLHPTQPRWLVLNYIGYEIACLCNGANAITQIAGHLADKYNIEISLASRHVKKYLSSLAEKGWFSSSPHINFESSSKLDSMYIQITEWCNLQCKHCYSWNGSRFPREYSFRQIKSLVDQAVGLNCKTLVLSGGEPLLHPQFSEIIQYASSKLKINILSNGTLIDGSTAKLLADHNVKIQISLDGATAEAHDRIRGYGAFAKTLKGIKFLKKAGVKVVICTVIMKENVGNEKSLVRLAQDLRCLYSRFIPLRCSGRAKENLQDIQPDIPQYADFCRQYLLSDSNKFPVNCSLSGLMLSLPSVRQKWCPIGRKIIINAQGEIYPCLLLMEKRHRLGHIEHVDLSRILSSPKMEQFRRIRDNRSSIIPKCTACSWKNFCQSGCLGLVYAQKGTFFETDNFCSLRQELFPQLIFKIARKKSLMNELLNARSEVSNVIC